MVERHTEKCIFQIWLRVSYRVTIIYSLSFSSNNWIARAIINCWYERFLRWNAKRWLRLPIATVVSKNRGHTGGRKSGSSGNKVEHVWVRGTRDQLLLTDQIKITGKLSIAGLGIAVSVAGCIFRRRLACCLRTKVFRSRRSWNRWSLRGFFFS